MTYQSQSNGYVAYKVQSGLGSQASGSSARVLRTTGGGYGKLTKAAVESNEIRQDGMRTRGRHGVQHTAGDYSTELSLGLCDDIFEALVRGTLSSADVAITEATASLTSITTTTNTIVAGGGSWITAGVRVGDVWRLTGHTTAANNGKNLPILGVTASTITVPTGSLTLNATPDTAFTLTKAGRTLINPAAGSLVERYFTIEEAELDIDGTELFTDCKWGAGKLSMQPNGEVGFDPSWMGTGQFATKTGASAPFFSAPSTSTGIPMAVSDATLYANGTAIVGLTAFDLTFDNHLSAPDTFGSPASNYAPDVFSGQMGVQLNLSMLRADLNAVADFIAETQWSLHVLMTENEAEPKDFVSLYVPNFTLSAVAKSAMNKNGGARTQSIQVPEALIGKDERGGAYDATMLKFQFSNAS